MLCVACSITTTSTARAIFLKSGDFKMRMTKVMATYESKTGVALFAVRGFLGFFTTTIPALAASS